LWCEGEGDSSMPWPISTLLKGLIRWFSIK
jgi:hypothetical protein